MPQTGTLVAQSANQRIAKEEPQAMSDDFVTDVLCTFGVAVVVRWLIDDYTRQLDATLANAQALLEDTERFVCHKSPEPHELLGEVARPLASSTSRARFRGWR